MLPLIEVGVRYWTDRHGVFRMVDPWWSFRMWWPRDDASIQDYGLKVGPLEVTLYRFRGRWGYSVKLVRTRNSWMMVD